MLSKIFATVCFLLVMLCDVFSGVCFAQYESMISQQIQIEKSVEAARRNSLENLKKYQSGKHSKAQPKQNTKYHHLMANMENTIIAKGGKVSPEESYSNAGDAYKARVQEYYAVNPSQDEIAKDISSVINSANIPAVPKTHDPAGAMASNIDIPKPKINKSSNSNHSIENYQQLTSSVNEAFLDEKPKTHQATVDNVNDVFFPEKTNTKPVKPAKPIYENNSVNSEAVSKPKETVSSEPAQYNESTVKPSDIYGDKMEGKADSFKDDKNKELSGHIKATGKDAEKIKSKTGTAKKIVNGITGTIKETKIFKKFKDFVLKTDDIAGKTADIIDAADIAVTANSLENKAQGAGFLYGGLKVLEKSAKTVFGPIGSFFTATFSIGAETTKAAVDNTHLYNVNTMQGEAQGLKQHSPTLTKFLKQNGEENQYDDNYKLALKNEEGGINTVVVDALGATKITLNNQEYYVFKSLDGNVSQAVIKIEKQPFWKFWKDDKATVYQADVSYDEESQNFTIENADMIADKTIA